LLRASERAHLPNLRERRKLPAGLLMPSTRPPHDRAALEQLPRDI
jgi:hypothetical protein